MHCALVERNQVQVSYRLSTWLTNAVTICRNIVTQPSMRIAGQPALYQLCANLTNLRLPKHMTFTTNHCVHLNPLGNQGYNTYMHFNMNNKYESKKRWYLKSLHNDVNILFGKISRKLVRNYSICPLYEKFLKLDIKKYHIVICSLQGSKR